MDMHDWPYIKKSARRKKRLVKKDFDKKLIGLDKQRDILWATKYKLPMVPLERPYQSGWKRLFALRGDILRSAKGEFYQTLLKKINTVQYHHDRAFKKRKRKRGKYVYSEKPQILRVIDEYDWLRNTLKLTDKEKVLFSPKETWSVRKKALITEYHFLETWRFVLVVKPHIIYEKKQHDELLEKEIKQIENRINRENLQPRMSKLVGGSRYKYWKWRDEPEKYKNELKNKPVYTLQEEYMGY
ncbi:hypothetical protein [Mucilaginibacter ginsenosidivorax]|uniref:Uncharacterized protein n=1 Tax=Mucilaginibacter ginsenosidivorax TaxID=862126 RepID=A0A5B8W177_9SPHI|nr:hypothetical protein [Mucilaginibacter ginsenosidivorax]QEC76632.1 hypothetical protein FSB76_11975 [Mucilaginibacter ginsenosidivorax]